VTTDSVFGVLSLAYTAEGNEAIAAGECDKYKCRALDDCLSLYECPALHAIRRKWEPIWAKYDQLASLVESGADTAQAYCDLRTAAKGVPIPKGACP
jgi:hypothetical protein